jgi:hypothetical protein
MFVKKNIYNFSEIKLSKSFTNLGRLHSKINFAIRFSGDTVLCFLEGLSMSYSRNNWHRCHLTLNGANVCIQKFSSESYRAQRINI